MKYILPIILIGLFIVGCASTPTPAPTVVPTDIPTPIPQPTQAPTNTALPPTPTTAPTNTLPPPTNTPIPTTPAPTATSTLAPVTREPTAIPTETQVAIKYGAPELIEPKQGDTRVARRDALVFRWNPVGDLTPEECYQLRLRLIHLADPNQNFAEQTYSIQETCNHNSGSGVVTFVVNGRAPAPNYDGLIAEADGKAGGFDSQEYLAQWDVVVAANQNGTWTPVSETSALGEFRIASQ